MVTCQGWWVKCLTCSIWGEMRNKVERSAERGILNQQPHAEKGTTQVIWSKSFSPLKSEKAGLPKGLLALPQTHLQLHGLLCCCIPQEELTFPSQNGTPRHYEGTSPLCKHHHGQEGANSKQSEDFGASRWLFPAAQHWWNHICSTTSSSGLQSTRLTWIYWSNSKEGLSKLRDERFLCTMRGWGCCNCFIWRTEAEDDPTCVNAKRNRNKFKYSKFSS